MGLLGVACALPTIWVVKTWNNPDNRFFRSNRKQVLRGDPAEVDRALDYNRVNSNNARQH